MNKGILIWTLAVRMVLFESLVRLFGPYRKWTGTTLPGRGLDDAYRLFLKRFAKAVGASSAEAVAHQIRFGSPIIGVSHWNHSLTRQGVLCLAASFHAGFIEHKDFPVAFLYNGPMPRKAEKRFIRELRAVEEAHGPDHRRSSAHRQSERRVSSFFHEEASEGRSRSRPRHNTRRPNGGERPSSGRFS